MLRRFLQNVRGAFAAQSLPFPWEAEQHPPDTNRIPDQMIWMR
ncbi:hypothetical protein [Diaminobutyricimonas aerilata]|nr:hypothetical protein [Diaminobutyricimonas aerilata]